MKHEREDGQLTEQRNDHQPQLDQELAALTDALLRGEPAVPSDEAEPLLEVAQQLQALIAPDETPRAEFQARLTQEIAAEWDLRGRPRVRARSSPAAWRTFAPVAAAAAAVLLLILVIPADAAFTVNLAGTASRDPGAGVVVSWRAAVFVIGSALSAVYLLYRLRR